MESEDIERSRRAVSGYRRKRKSGNFSMDVLLLRMMVEDLRCLDVELGVSCVCRV